jgi:hypothetical protein
MSHSLAILKMHKNSFLYICVVAGIDDLECVFGHMRHILPKYETYFAKLSLVCKKCTKNYYKIKEKKTICAFALHKKSNCER